MNAIIKNNCINIKAESDCCGCRNCENICPNDALTMIQNKEGFYYPQINFDKCLDCGLCNKVCPMLQSNADDAIYLEKNICYAFKNKNKQTQLNSTSGGAFAAFAEHIINNGGYVCGSVMDKDLKVKHIIVNNINDLAKLYGSKYVASDLNDVFVDIKKLLNNDKTVLFCGVPCQVNALLKFLPKSYDNLFTLELICHGVPSQKLFDKYIEYYEKKHKCKVLKYEFRSKKAAVWGTFKALAKVEKNGKISEKKINADFDKYYNSFLKASGYRESCYKCRFADVKRYADITMGDFWGVEHLKPDFYDPCGVSEVIINSHKGLQLFENIKDYVICEKIDFEKAIRYNSQLHEPTERPAIRDKFYNNIESDTYFNNMRIDINPKAYIKVLVPSKLKLKLKKLLK